MNKKVTETTADDEDDIDVMGLSPQELAALEESADDIVDPDNEEDETDVDDPDDEEDEAAAKARAEADAAAAAEKDDDPEGDDKDDDGDALDPEAIAAAAAAAAEGNTTDDGTDDGADDAGTDRADGDGDTDSGRDTATHLVADEIADYDEKLAEFKTAKEALRTQLNDGEIDLDKYEAEKDRINDEIYDLKQAKREAEFVARQNEAAAKQRWETTQEMFYAQGDNAEFYNNEDHFVVFNHHIKTLAADPANVNKSGTWIINKADEKARAVFGATKGATTTTGDGKDGKDGKPPKEAKRPDLSKVPKTLSSIPAAELENTGDAEFAYLDKLSGMELENAVAAMTPEQQERYARS